MKKKTIVHKFFEIDRKDRKMYMLQVTTIRTLIVAIVKFVFGVLYKSVWFFSNSIFYIILSFCRYRSIRDYRKVKRMKDKELKRNITYRNYLYNGWLLVLLGIAYLGMNFFMYKSGVNNNNLGGYLVYLVALISFSSFGTAIAGIVKYRRKNDPILAAVCQSNIAMALTSIVLTQVVLLDEFCEKSIEIVKADAITGMAVGAIIILLGIRMVVKIIRGGKNEINFTN